MEVDRGNPFRVVADGWLGFDPSDDEGAITPHLASAREHRWRATRSPKIVGSAVEDTDEAAAEMVEQLLDELPANATRLHGCDPRTRDE